MAPRRHRQRTRSIQPSEWLPQVWSDGGRSATPAYGNSGDAQKIMALILRHMVGIQRTLTESPTRFKPLLYLPEEKKSDDKQPPEGTAWCEGYMAGVKLRDDAWQPLYEAEDARDWVFPIEALAFGDQDPSSPSGSTTRKIGRAWSRSWPWPPCSSIASGRFGRRPSRVAPAAGERCPMRRASRASACTSETVRVVGSPKLPTRGSGVLAPCDRVRRGAGPCMKPGSRVARSGYSLLRCGNAAVDVEHLAGDEVRRARQEKQHGTADIVHLGDAAERDALEQLR